MAPPSCPITGKHLRYALLTGVLGYLIYFLYTGISQDPTTSNVVYICNTNLMVECDGVDDATTCIDYKDASGQESTCIESSCGYKLFDHIDISVAGTSDPRDESAGTLPDLFVSVMAIAYSLMPYAIAFVYLVLFLSTGSLVPLSRFVVFGAIAVLNEAIFKRLVKEHRPEGSCLYFQSYGMPSGHAETSIGLLTYILLEMFVMHPNILCGLTCQKDASNYTFKLGYGWIKTNSPDSDNEEPLQTNNDEETGEAVLNNEASSTALIQHKQDPTTPKWFCHICALLYTIIFLPVPFSRVYLHDHYSDQVLIGGCIGVVVSILCYLGLMRGLGLHQKMSRFANGEWGQWWGIKSSWDWGFL